MGLAPHSGKERDSIHPEFLMGTAQGQGPCICSLTALQTDIWSGEGGAEVVHTDTPGHLEKKEAYLTLEMGLKVMLVCLQEK